jgi:hypothetical protein
MKKELHPSWSKQEQLEGERMRQMWEEFVPAAQQTGEASGPLLSKLADEQRLSTVLARHQAALMSYPNVVGVADGIKTKRGEPTGERCLVVLVKRKLPKSKLRKTEILPREIEGVPIDVVEVGKIEPLPL